MASPDGRLTFRLFIGQPEPGGLSRLAYQVLFQGKRIVDTSYFGFEFLNQEPLLGENDGQIGYKASAPGSEYRSMIAEYMQNGSIGRRIDIEARAYNDGIAFRCLLPRQTPLQELLLSNEVTEFRFPDTLNSAAEGPMPLIVPRPGIGFLAIAEVRSGGYPPASLAHLDPNTLVTRLPSLPDDPFVAYAGTTPFASPWRVIIIGAGKDRLLQSAILQSLKP